MKRAFPLMAEQKGYEMTPEEETTLYIIVLLLKRKTRF